MLAEGRAVPPPSFTSKKKDGPNLTRAVSTKMFADKTTTPVKLNIAETG